MFSKGQQVTYFVNYDRKGTVQIRDLVVYSCGKKQMVLCDENGVKFQGASFLPTVAQYSMCEVHPSMTEEAATAYALELGAKIVASELASMEAAIISYGYAEDAGYNKSMRRKIAELHEPRVKGGAQ